MVQVKLFCKSDKVGDFLFGNVPFLIKNNAVLVAENFDEFIEESVSDMWLTFFIRNLC